MRLPLRIDVLLVRVIPLFNKMIKDNKGYQLIEQTNNKKIRDKYVQALKFMCSWYCKGSRKNSYFFVFGPLRGGGRVKAGPQKNFFETPKKSYEKRVTTKLDYIIWVQTIFGHTVLVNFHPLFFAIIFPLEIQTRLKMFFWKNLIWWLFSKIKSFFT